MTTDDLLRLEEAGGVITFGGIPAGLDQNSSISDWYRMFPNVSMILIDAWFDYTRSKSKLEDIIAVLKKD